MNQANLIGRLVRDPIHRITSSGIVVTRFTLAIDRYYGKKAKESKEKGSQTADFIPCVAWRGRAETIAKYCKKGARISVTGPMQSRNYTDSAGLKHYTIECRVDDFSLLESRRANPATESPEVPDETIPF